MKIATKSQLITRARLKVLRDWGVYYGRMLPAPVTSIGELLDRLLPDEKISKLAECMYEGKQGILSITTNRVIFIYASSLSAVATLKDFYLTDLIQVNVTTAVTSGILITSGEESMKIIRISPPDVDAIVEALKSPADFSSYTAEDLFPEELPQYTSKSGLGFLKNSVRYGMSLVMLLLGIGWIVSSPAQGFIIGLAGFFILMTALCIAPFTTRYFSTEARVYGSACSFILVILIFSFIAQTENERINRQNEEAERLFQDARGLFLKEKLDAAGMNAKAEEVKHKYTDSINNPASRFQMEYDSLHSKTYLLTKLRSLSDSDYAALKAGTLQRPFLSDSTLNVLFVEKLILSSALRAATKDPGQIQNRN